MLSEEKTRKILERCISDLDMLIEKIDDAEENPCKSNDVSLEMYDVAEQLDGAINVLREVLEIKA